VATRLSFMTGSYLYSQIHLGCDTLRLKASYETSLSLAKII